jgi:hypothetical protein
MSFATDVGLQVPLRLYENKKRIRQIAQRVYRQCQCGIREYLLIFGASFDSILVKHKPPTDFLFVKETLKYSVSISSRFAIPT